MIKILGKQQSFCDGVSRRNFLQIGALGLGGLALPDLLRAEAQSGRSISAQKSIIMIYLPGGPSHQDMYDIKEDAPSEFRGEFHAISTCVPGVRICEHMPQLAANFDKFVAVRSITDSAGEHSSFQKMTGHPGKSSQAPTGGWPSVGAVVSKLQSSNRSGIPPYIGLNGMSAVGAGFLGAAHSPFSPSGKGKADMVLNGITLDRLEDRKTLLTGIDSFRRAADASGQMEGLDSFNQEAFSVVTSSKLVQALAQDLIGLVVLIVGCG